ncbi:WAT1-related protein At5g40230-like isoform X1 [Cynara cardunculus var. scolymus]|uniref:WAT1-related protein At5g40230-like isoform X1 n=1 Tax=Cynara cardunculus var. scolymus TaxID=59895 RepID=UPI000D62712F|nr:WAT1-related protein At5g40230-like isoform X1 [Cynara cardunculus var. scolymus]
MVGGERRRCIYRDVLPFAAMVMVEFMIVGGNTLFKSATAQGSINSYVFTFYVFLLGFFFLLPCLFILNRRTTIPPIKFSIVVKIFLLSVLMYLSQVFGYIGLKYGSPTLSSIMSNLSPAFTFMLAFFFRMETIDFRTYTTRAKVTGTIVSIAGALVAMLYSGPTRSTYSFSLNSVIGGVLLASQYFLVAFALVAQAKIMLSYPIDIMVVFVFSVSGLFVAGLAGLVMARDSDAWKLKLDVILATTLYMGFTSGFLTVVIQIWTLRKKGPVYVAMFKPLTIVIAIVMGVLFLGDSLQFGSVAGGMIITIGFYGVVWGKAKEESGPSAQTTVPLLQPHHAIEDGGSIVF